MNVAYSVFSAIIQDTKNSDILYTYLHDVVKPPYDYSDLLRWQWAQAVSALDKLIHDLIRVGMIYTFLGLRQPTQKYLAFTIDLRSYEEMQRNELPATNVFERQITQQLSYLSFQEPTKIAEGLSLIWNENHKWRCIADRFGETEDYTKTKLKNISIRRNQIVHEGDYSSSQLQRQQIAHADVVDVIDFISRLGEAIYQLVR